VTRRLLAAVVLSAALGSAAPAGAATITVSGPASPGVIPVTITATGGPGTDTVRVGQHGLDVITVTADPGSSFSGSLVAPGKCEAQQNVLHCHGFLPSRIDVDATLGDGADSLALPDQADSFWPTTGGSVDMGDGSDQVDIVDFERHRSGAVWAIHGGAGDDVIRHRDAVVEDGTGAATHDVIDGGAGNDITFAGSDDFVDGGAGDDRVEMDDDESRGVAGGGTAAGGAGTDRFDTDVGDGAMAAARRQRRRRARRGRFGDAAAGVGLRLREPQL
jgi:hypothetical protein